MFIVWFFLAWFIGIITGALCLAQPLVIIRFAIPLTLRLKKLGVLLDSKPLYYYCLSLVVLPVLLCLISWGIHSWLPDAVLGYWVGVVMTLWLARGKCSANADNIQDYLRTNVSSIDAEALQTIDLLTVFYYE
jgi:hypothetical protein